MSKDAIIMIVVGVGFGLFLGSMGTVVAPEPAAVAVSSDGLWVVKGSDVFLCKPDHLITGNQIVTTRCTKAARL